MDENAKQQIVERLQDANNVLVTVSTNPSVDQLAACIALTLLMNHLGKHGSAVFSGKIPSTIEFLEPEKTLEPNTNSLRDFIIALDKSKADKLRYKVEDRIVKIFITPYRTSLSQEDLDFSQGDFNVDAVLALGVHEREDLDQAITAHGRILHDATVISINNRDHAGVGTVNWVDLEASSLSEMIVALAKDLSKDPLDSQMATALMTGIVAETERFSNDKTSPHTMTIASELMSAGANQQLIATKLEGFQPIPQIETPPPPPPANSEEDDVESRKAKEADRASHDGALRIKHDADDEPSERYDESLAQLTDQMPLDPEPSSRHQERVIQPPPLPKPLPPLPPIDNVKPSDTSASRLQGTSNMVLEPPMMGGQLTANTQPEHAYLEPNANPLSLPPVSDNSNAYLGRPQMQLPPFPQQPPAPMPPQQPLPPQPPPPPPGLPPRPPLPPPPPPLQPIPQPQQPQPLPPPDSRTLSNLEQTVDSPHNEAPPQAPFNPPPHHVETVDEAREAVDEAIRAAGGEERLEPIVALGAQPLGESLHPDSAPQDPAPNPFAPPEQSLPTEPFTMPEAVVTPQQSQPPADDTSRFNGTPAEDTFMNPSTPRIVTPTNQTGPIGFGAPPPPVPPPMMPSMGGGSLSASEDDQAFQPPVL